MSQQVSAGLVPVPDCAEDTILKFCVARLDVGFCPGQEELDTGPKRPYRVLGQSTQLEQLTSSVPGRGFSV